jgi:hypothetical protein
VIADECLNVAARIMLRACRPLTAYRLLMWVGRALPPYRTGVEMNLAARRLRPRGTCLTRSLAIAARSPGAEIVLGVAPGTGGTRLLAHAWLEFGGEPLDASDPMGKEIARIPWKVG